MNTTKDDNLMLEQAYMSIYSEKKHDCDKEHPGKDHEEWEDEHDDEQVDEETDKESDKSPLSAAIDAADDIKDAEEQAKETGKKLPNEVESMKVPIKKVIDTTKQRIDRAAASAGNS